MKPVWLLLILSGLLGACVSPGIKVPIEEVQRIKTVHIVAMEPPPLTLYGVPRAFLTTVIETGDWIQVAPGIGLYNTIPILGQMPEAARRGGGPSQTLPGARDAKGIWVPTVAIASDVQAQLAPAGIEAIVVSDVKPIPDLQNRNYKSSEETWVYPIRDWYNNTKPVSEYAGLSFGQRVYVVEVETGVYVIWGGKLRLSVLMKVIDASSGQVIGRARVAKGESPTVDPLDQALADDAKRFKEVFAAQARALVRECLSELGLVR